MHIVFMLMFYGWIVFMLQTMVYSFKKYKSFNMFKIVNFCLPFMWSWMAQVPFASFTKEEMQVSQRLKNVLKVKDW